MPTLIDFGPLRFARTSITRRRRFPIVIGVAAALAAAPFARASGLVVRLTPAADATRAAVFASLRDLGLGPATSLADVLPAGREREAAAPRSPYDLDPARTFLLEAPGPVAAVARARLEARADVAWVEPVRTRAAAVVSIRAAGGAHTLDAPMRGSGGSDTPGRGGSDDAPAGLTVAPAGLPDDPLLRDTRQWGLWNAGPAGAYGGDARADVAAPEAWRMSSGAPDVRLAIADTGLDPAHPDLAAVLPGGPRIERGLDLTSPDRGAWADSSGHGTPVAGVMAALTNDGPHFDSLGVAGVCGGDGRGNPGCRIVPIKIARVRTATSWDIALAILHATAAGARAMNLSFAGAGPSRLEREALHHAVTRGCVVVAAAGNKGASTPTAPMYPAAYAADGLCIAVGASDARDRRAVFSSYGPGLDLVAPGLDVWTTFMTYPAANGTRLPPYVVASGTSFAAPFVTGAVGLLAAARPELRDTDFQRLLRESARDVGEPGLDAETGWGRLDLASALAAVSPEVGIWHDEAAATHVVPGGRDTLWVGESGPGAMDRARLWPAARMVEIRATVSLPDSFADLVRVWPRVGGTMTVRGGFRLPYFAPWAEVASLDPRGRRFTLRGYLYRNDAAGESDAADAWLPLPPDQARFGFTVIGRVRRDTLATAATHTPPSATPNPFRDRVRLVGVWGGVVYDLAGRMVRSLDGITADETWWDGRDASGRAAPAGLYFVRAASGSGRALRVLKLDPR